MGRRGFGSWSGCLPLNHPRFYVLGGDNPNGKTTSEMQTTSTFLEAGWDFVDETANGTENIWRIFEYRDYPRLWWETTGQ